MANKLETPLAAVNGGFDYALLTGKNDLYNYDNGKRSSEKVGTKITVSLQGNRLLSLTIKVEGDDPLPDVTDDVIAETCKQRKYVYVKLIDCIVSIYTMNGNMGMSATAKSCELVGNSK